MALKGTFFITSLPRSRTAWLANLLTYRDSFCYHEALKHCPSAAGIKDLFEKTGTPYVGNSDSGLPFVIDKAMEIFPKARLVVVERDPLLVIQSLERVFPNTGVNFAGLVEKTTHALDVMIKKYSPMIFQYEDMNSEKKCRELWEHCLPGHPFDKGRWKMLDGLTIEIHPQKYLQSFPPETAKWITEMIATYEMS